MSDKQGNHPHPQYLCDGFRAAIDDCNLTELDLTEGEYTWEKSKGTPDWVRERLDRAFANNDWWQKFPLCKLCVKHAIYSDHDPIVLDLLNVSFSRKNFRFRFENVWLKEPNFHIEVSDFWKGIASSLLLPKLISVSSFMAKWGRNFFHKFRDKVKKQKDILDKLINRNDQIGVGLYFEEKDRLDDLMKQEEVYWQQRAKAFWLTEGDKNSKFFHAQASARKKGNHIDYLKTENGDRVDNQDEMCDIAVAYFKDIFKEGNVVDLDQGDAVNQSVITES